MSAVRLLVLGVLRRDGPAHGYAVRRELLSWRAETWTNVKPGSIYHALKQLCAEGKLREAGTESGGAGPGRTLFELTEAGEAEFRALLDRALVSIDMEELGAAIAFMDALPRAHVVARLREQQRNAAAVRDDLLAMIPEFPARHEVPHATDLLELWSGVFDTLTRWTGGLVARLEAGEYHMSD
ncbi:PadR family transcriptional regulator [Nocardia farcinica]|uniref:PadR family transcriptional regulator n=1 Tax=Nocardia farcinica TaxID=37329 RepID=UPI00189382D7|nr:PadR family transcriptional regulator [Nocardia farcinica]MBF6257431.1 PadR family transcriptional regulator [Nocardia farcinica]MBF6266134.1 PadR family transcriptional regulator [Nocardia farcinica]MBF6417951.1 PadR family transcriptional regulator [Nocardia farcinica]MBF6429428.1 PadR family transcriptional regulator [Nocardia farcinica]MBF6443171.1 PadR family transcriptional regulator [Nocardia farcinica]